MPCIPGVLLAQIPSMLMALMLVAAVMMQQEGVRGMQELGTNAECLVACVTIQ